MLHIVTLLGYLRALLPPIQMPSDILPYDHRALCAMACHGLVFLIFKTRFLASFLFLLQGVLLG